MSELTSITDTSTTETSPTETSPIQDLELPSRTGGDVYPLFLLLGVFFGIVAIKSEIVSWYRMQEMFRFQAFHMYGIIGSAIAVGAVSTRLLRRFVPKTLAGDALHIPAGRDPRSPRLVIGGFLFGLGWGLVGACPGPIFALLGNGMGIMAVVLVSALAGTWTYAWLRPHLPH